jgi:AraC family transcriptional regulator of adaptative response / DNA-3-methyladenine glycosylase II
MHATAVYERARLSRDTRFDGQFFTGVKTTGIYCRPVCPANPPKPENVTYFPSAAAASEAGFRPCLRCRPECAPGTPAWHGSSTTVRRGLRLIASGALDGGNVEQLAERLGVTSRHLRRLFRAHLGASPLAVAHTQRLHFAKRLIDQTRLSLADIAAAAGYGSIRRFNDAFRTTYGRAPRDLRKHFNAGPPPDATLVIELPYRRPFDWPQLLAFAAARAIPGVEAVADSTYRRTVRVGGRPGVITLAHNEPRGCLQLRVDSVDTADLFLLVQKVREMFDLDAPVQEIRRVLVRDPALKMRLGRQGLVRVPGAWDGFELAIRAVLGQQVSVSAATTLSGRLVARSGTPLKGALAKRATREGLTHLFPEPTALARAELAGLGITGARSGTIRRLAAAVAAGNISFDTAGDPDAFCASLCLLRGIGEWTAQYVAMRALKNPDAFPSADLGLLRAFDGEGRRLRPTELEERAEAWRPWRAYAALLLWNSTPHSGG